MVQYLCKACNALKLYTCWRQLRLCPVRKMQEGHLAAVRIHIITVCRLELAQFTCRQAIAGVNCRQMVTLDPAG